MDKTHLASHVVIAAQGITKYYGNVKVLADINLSIERGEIFGVLGPNGSGKTTLLRILCGLLLPCSGTGHCLDIDFSAPSHSIRKRQRRIGYLAQNFTLYDELSVAENLLFRARIFALEQPEKCIERALNTYGLAEKSRQMAGQLSGGWRRRLELAACLLHQPDLVMLDEPTAGVDTAARGDFWFEIERLAHAGVTVLVNTHDISEAERCNRIAYLSQGRIVISGTPQDLIGDANCAVWWLSGERVVTDYASQLQRLPGVVHLENRGKQLKLISHRHPATVTAIKTIARQYGLDIQSTAPRLDEALLQLLHANGGKKRGGRSA